MRMIIKNAPPASLVKYAREVGASYDAMDKDVKDDLKTALLNEQGWVCGYCQQKISSESQMKVEHFCEQSICADKTLDYTNLMAVCKGDAGFGNLHCDTQKATFNTANGLPIEISPWIPAHMSGIRYAPSGTISTPNHKYNQEINSVLNLNNKLLKEQRKKKFTQIFALSKHANKLKEKMRRLLEQDLTKTGSKYSNNFPGLSEYMLRKFC